MSWEAKRKHKRVNLKISVECRGKNFWQCVITNDISAGGMFIATDRVEPPQANVDVMFEIGDDHKRPIHAKGRVTWVRTEPIIDEDGQIQPSGMGIMFTKLVPLMAKDYIEEMIKNSGG